MKTNSRFQMKQAYEAPSIEIIDAAVEQGFAVSYGDKDAPGGNLGGGNYEF